MIRSLTYCDALREALDQEMTRDPTVFVYGIGVPTHAKVFGSVAGLVERFPGRVFDTPISESAMTGFGLGAAVGGLRPVHIHIRPDFLVNAMGQLVNMVSTMAYSTQGRVGVPLTIRAVVGRGYGQGWQHSKSLHSLFAHIPGLKVVAPTRARDAKGLLTAAIRDNNPVIVLEHRWLYWAEDDVPEGDYVTPIGPNEIVREGTDLTIAATSWMVVEALKAAEILSAKVGVSVEVVDIRTLAPFHPQVLFESVLKTRHLIVADNDWVECGFGAEVSATVGEQLNAHLKMPVARLGWAHTPCPTVRCLENEFYPNAVTIVREAEDLLSLAPVDLSGEDFYSHERRFKGPF